MTNKERKIKLKFYRDYVGQKKIKEGFMKRGIYGSVFDMPKKINRALKHSKNNNHRDYMINTFKKIAEKFNNKKILEVLNENR